MGIRNLTLFLLAASFCWGGSAFASANKHDIILKVCGSIKGNVNDYETPEKYEKEDGKTCYKVGCRAETGSRGDDAYDITVNYRTRCFTTQEIVDRMFGDDLNGDVNGEFDLVIRGSGTTGANGTTGSNGSTGNAGVDISVNGNSGGGWFISGKAVSEAEWRNKCIKRNGKIRSKCTRGMSVYNDYYTDSGNRGVNIGGKYVVVRRSDGTEFKCAYTTTWEHCLGGDATNVIVGVYGDADHCVNCGSNGNKSGSTLSGIAEIAGAILPPLAYLGSNWLWSDAYLGSNQAWAGAAATGFEQCQIMQSNHIQSMYGNGTTNEMGFFSNNGLPYEQVSPPNCNGYQVGGFAGGMGFMGNGFGGFGSPFMSAGYSPGMIGGMSGPYGMYNPYGAVNGMGGMYPGMGGMGGLGGGIGINIGGGMGMPGMGGMYPGMGGMGMGGMYPGMGGMGMGGMYPGMGGGIGIGGGMGMPGMGMGTGMGYPGYAGGMYGGGIYGNGGGMYGNPWGGGGAMGTGTVPWGNGAGSYWNGSGGWGNGNANYGNIQQSYMASQQAAGMDAYYQQNALQNNFSQAAGNLYGYGAGYNGYGMGGNYGYAPYSPGNMGLGMSLGFGFGF